MLSKTSVENHPANILNSTAADSDEQSLSITPKVAMLKYLLP